MTYLDNTLVVIIVLMNVAFITLLERKILSFSQLRLGPNKPGILGLLQPGADAIKLFSNKFIFITSSNTLYAYAPMWALSLSLFLWSILPSHFSSSIYEYGILMFLMILSISIYPLMLTGWSAKNKYTTIGAMRSVAQTISYEISLIFVTIGFTITLFFISPKQLYVSTSAYSLMLLPSLIFMWMIILLAETNRTPFDFSEGESELVSGFNTEFSASKFAIIFMTEYAMIYLFANLTQLLYLFSFIFIVIFWIWVRATLPRHRYDLLMSMNWKILLPLSMLGPMICVLSICFYNKI